jgi:hypothetical protein
MDPRNCVPGMACIWADGKSQFLQNVDTDRQTALYGVHVFVVVLRKPSLTQHYRPITWNMRADSALGESGRGLC